MEFQFMELQHKLVVDVLQFFVQQFERGDTMTTSVGSTRIIRECLSKTEYSDTRISSPDASQLTSLAAGSVMLQLVFDNPINNGVYSLCNPDAYFTDYLLFAVNPAGKYVTPPGIYAALTPDGIELTVWTKKGKYTILDTSTTVAADEYVTIEFAWDSSEVYLGSKATMAIYVDGEVSAAGNYPISNDSLSGIEFTALDSEFMEYGLLADVCDFVVVDGVLPRIRQKVESLTRRYLGNNFLLLAGRDGSLLFPDLLERGPFFEPRLSCLGDGRYCVSVSDTDRAVYFASYDGDDTDSGSVVKYVDGEITARIDGLRNPRAVAVQQADGIDYQKLLAYPERSCAGVWIADEDRVIYTDSDLNMIAEQTGFSGPQCVAPLSDGRAWVCDTGNDRVVFLDENNASVLATRTVLDPTFGMCTVRNEFYAFDSTISCLAKFSDTVRVAELGLGGEVSGIDINPNTGTIVVGYTTGWARIYNRNFTPVAGMEIHGPISALMVKRGYLRDSFYWVDFQYRYVNRNRFTDLVTRLESASINDLLFNGGMAGPAHNLTTTTAEFDMGAPAIGDFDSIYDLDAPQYKVDKLEVDLSGGRENEKTGVDFGDFVEGKPTDLRRGAVKASRLPE